MAVNLLDSLLDAIIRLDGDALVMHVGEKPYVVTTSEATNEFRGPLAWGQVELSSRMLTSEALAGMLGQILPLDQRAALDEFGATEYDVTAAQAHAERFTVVAARGGDDIWIELRRLAKLKPEPVIAIAPVSVLEADGTPADSDETTESHQVASDVALEPEPSSADVHSDVSDEPETHLGDTSDVELVGEEPIVELEAAEEDTHGAPEYEMPVAIEQAHEPADDLPEPIEAVDEETSVSDEEPFTSVAHVIADQDWGDDVMTEGDLGELLRASASAIIIGESANGSERAESSASSVAVEHADTYLRMPIALSDEPASAARPAAVAVNNEPVAVAEEHEVTLALPLDAADAVASDDHEAAASAEPIATHDVAIVSSGDDDRERDSMEERFDVVADSRPVGRPASDESIPVTVGTETMADEAGEQPVSFDDHTPEVFVEDIQLPGSEPAHASVPGHDVISEAASEAPFSSEVEEDEATPVRPPAIVVPLTRQGRSDAAGDVKGGVAATLQRLLRLAAARGAATVYVVAQSAPMVRVDGEFSVLDGEPTLNSAFVERLLAELAPHTREAGAPAAEWIADVPEIGRVRCVTFRDHRGPGIIFRMVPPRAISADQLGLSAEVQALCTDADGLVLVAGGRGSGRSTLLTSFVDLVNRTRSDHVITVEPHIEFVHENKRSFISQREVRGSAEAVGAAVRAAGREEPDVLVVEDLRTPELVAMALEAAESGRLVFVSVPAVSTISAVERFIEMFPAERREKAQASLAAALRGVVSQVLLRKLRGGRVAAREVLINTPEVAALIAEGKISQLMHALETGRKQGMMSFAESFSALVREGVVHPSHAYRKAPDREHFLTLLRRDGVDTTIAERLA